MVRDSIHGDVFLTRSELEIVDTPEFQRLRRIKQLGATFLVYPGANHTRFEHSIGAMHLAGRISANLNLDSEEVERVRAAALLHDMGHGPLSHTSEELLERHLGTSHESRALDTIKGSRIADILGERKIDPEEIGEMINGRGGYLGKIISSDFDVDRMDFLVRDAHHTGVAYGIIDLDRLLHTIEVFEGSLVITERGLKAVEALLVARILMTPTVYLHHASRVADAMFLKATERAIEEGKLDYAQLYAMDDYDIHNLFRHSKGYIREIGRRFDERRLFKKAYLRTWNELDAPTRQSLIELREDVERWKAMEREIAEECRLDYGYVLIDIPAVPKYEETGALILRNGKVKSLEEVSPLVSVLKKTQRGYWNVGVYAPEEALGAVSKVCEGIESYLEVRG